MVIAFISLIIVFKVLHIPLATSFFCNDTFSKFDAFTL